MKAYPAHRPQRKPQGLILWQGASLIDGAPIVCVATGIRRPSRNEKTGNMLQTWILRADVPPLEAINSGADESICGACPLRGIIDRSGAEPINRLRACYVTVRNAPNQVWHAFKAGAYASYDAKLHAQFIRGRMLRLGAYGDPAAVPYRVWRPLCDLAKGWTGYTHQWREGRFWRMRRLVMASCESIADASIAQGRGWRTFRTAAAGSAPLRGALTEFGCPAAEENGKRLTCEECGACNGAGDNPGRASVQIWAHGSPAVLSSYQKIGGEL